MARDLFDDLARECLARLPRTPVPRKSHVPPSDLERDLIVRNGGHATNLAREPPALGNGVAVNQYASVDLVSDARLPTLAARRP